jgi:hypothetical protein
LNERLQLFEIDKISLIESKPIEGFLYHVWTDRMINLTNILIMLLGKLNPVYELETLSFMESTV